VTLAGVDVAVQPLASVTVTARVPFEFTVIALVVSPLLQAKEVPPKAVNTTLPPWQNAVGPLADIVAVGRGFTVTASEVEALQPFASVTVTV